jgi:hypothetical protein
MLFSESPSLDTLPLPQGTLKENKDDTNLPYLQISAIMCLQEHCMSSYSAVQYEF